MAAGLRFLKGINEPSNLELRTSNLEQKQDTKRLWERHVRARNATVKLFQRKTCKVLNEFRAKTLAKLNEIHLEKSGVSGLASKVEKGLVDLIFNANEFGSALKLVLEHPIRSTLQQAGDEARREVEAADPWMAPPKFVSEFITGRTQPILNVGGVVRDQLNTSLDAGYDAGETTAELAARVKATFNNLTDGEAMRVARTETGIAFESARDKALEAAGIEFKAWLSSHGPNVRSGHAQAEDAYIDNPIPSDEPFVVDMEGEAERLMFPGDDSLGASPGNIINCQCVRVPAVKEGEDEKGATFKVFGMGRMFFAHAEDGRAGLAKAQRGNTAAAIANNQSQIAKHESID